MIHPAAHENIAACNCYRYYLHDCRTPDSDIEFHASVQLQLIGQFHFCS